MGCLQIPSSQGMVWRSEWEVPEEGTFSLAAKVTSVNELKFSTAREWIFAKNKTSSLLGHDPIRTVLCSTKVRYCRRCMTYGYHSWLYQLWSIERCPAHDELLRTTCEKCMAPMPLYPYNERTSTEPALRCHRCTEPYGLSTNGLFSAGWRGPEWLTIIMYRAWELRWLGKHVTDSVKLANQKRWSPTAHMHLGEEEDILRGQAVFWMLEAMYGESSKPIGLGSSSRFDPLNRLQAIHVATLARCTLGDLDERLKSKVTLSHFRQKTVTPSFGVAVPVSSKVPAWVHAVNLWRKQYEGVPIYLLGGVPTDHRDAIWAAACLIASEWHKSILQLEARSDEPARQAALLATEERWSRRLGKWETRDFTPFLSIEDRSDRFLTIM